MIHRAHVPAKHITASAMKNSDVCPAHPRFTLSRQVVPGPPGTQVGELRHMHGNGRIWACKLTVRVVLFLESVRC